METQLAQRIATDSWRLNRASAIEDNLFALGQLQNAAKPAPTSPKSTQPSPPRTSSPRNQNNSNSSLSTSSASTAPSKRTSPCCNPCKPPVKRHRKPP